MTGQTLFYLAVFLPPVFTIGLICGAIIEASVTRGRGDAA